jgi:Zn ribbon nucleic-acid-binding protein
MTYGDAFDDGAQPICPSCGITMHPLLDEGIEADECRECGFRLAWVGGDHDATDEGWGD